MHFTTQHRHRLRCEWGPEAIERLAPHVDTVVIVDVLSFTTCVEVACSRGATVFPWALDAGGVTEFAAARGAIVASRDRSVSPSLSPTSLLAVERNLRLVLPSPNGSRLSRAVGERRTFAACLRNAPLVAREVERLGGDVLVVPAGERWPGDTLRPALEDLVGAGAVLAGLSGSRSPEADAAVAAFERAHADDFRSLHECSSAIELIDRGFRPDVELAFAYGGGAAVPHLVEGAYRDLREVPTSA